MKLKLALLFLLTTSLSIVWATSPTINVSTVGASSLDNLSTLDNNGVIVGSFTISSSGTSGFSLNLESDSVTDSKPPGKLVRYDSGYKDASLAGNFCTYTISLAAVSGTLGCTQPTLPDHLSLSSICTLTYTTYVSNTVDYKYNVKINTTPKSQLFSGNFKDTLTLSITDL